MKKILCILSILLAMNFSINKVGAMSFEEALNEQKPMAVLIYADWADNYDTVLNTFKSIEPQFQNKYNFVELNIASKDAKAFNKRYHIYPNLPYVLLFKDRARVSRYLMQDCILNNSCFTEKLTIFAN